ncbi:MAG: AAA family ATPase [Elusimicrobia bacterium]|nr:AAA family ATPase [Elusimicrobiota bacterium]
MSNLLKPVRPLQRYLRRPVSADLARKMVFVGGPRQVGKTTFALGLLGPRADESHPAYQSWDSTQDRERLLAGELPPGQPLVLLDEIHKFARWRNLLKGFYDKHKSGVSFLVTGSARLDYYRKGGDSLQGRYHYYRLHPLSLAEVDAEMRPSSLEHLMRYGGFPEPFLRGDDREWRRWLRELRERVVHEDLRDLERVREVSLIDLLLHHLPACVGSPLSVKSLSSLLQVAHESVESWISVLERLYVCFRIAPFGGPRIRAVKKEKKLYLWDWSQVPEPGPRFENLVACQLLKYCHWQEDVEGRSMELRYLRDTDKREIDFVVLREGKPEFAVECKTGESAPSSAARYFRARTPIASFYQTHRGRKDFGHAATDVRVLPFTSLCRELGLP